MDAPQGQAPQDANTDPTGDPNTAPASGPAPETGQGPETTGTRTDDQDAARPDTDDQRPAAERVEDLPDWAQRIIRETRTEAADHRTRRTAAERALDSIRKAIDPDAESDQAPDADALATQLATERAARRDQAAELVLHRAAGDLGIDPGAVADSRAFERALAELDPGAEDFADQVKAAATKAAEDNPRLKATSSAPSASSGGRMTNAGAPTVDQQIADARKRGDTKTAVALKAARLLNQ
ncbi:hypothetical protein [Nocardiopsis alba]|uniref:hypothetical protein n=1 Tax=Nocardiopsis alba TaxID=53437 RepID=UPI0035D8C03F